jgi:ribonuclease HI
MKFIPEKTYRYSFLKNIDAFTQHSERFDYSDKHYQKLIIRFDGACLPTNPNGDMGYGWAIFKEDDDIIAHGWGYYLFNNEYETSNNIAEWSALYFGAKYLTDNNILYKDLVIIGDSTLVINQCDENWKINKDKPYTFFAELFMSDIKPLLNSKTQYRWQRRDNNEYCDMLSNKFLNIKK